MATKKTLIGNIKGPKGNPGDKGETGATGAPGTAATINVGTVTTSAYGTTAQVTNSGTETAAVFDFVIPQGKPGEETTRMSALTLDQVTASTETQPIPAVGEVGAVVWGKVIKFFTDVKTTLANKINYDDCVANLTSTSSKLPLAANQGKALKDNINTLNDAITSKLAKSNIVLTHVATKTLPADQGRSVNTTGSFGAVDLMPGFYILVSESSVPSSSFSGRTQARFFGNNSIVGHSTLMPPTVNGYYYDQLLQFILVTSGTQSVTYGYYDTVSTGVNHIWNVYRVISL